MKRRYFDLPANITYSSGKSAAYIYDANGQKLRTSYKSSASATAVPTDYCGNMIYETELLERAYVYTLPLMLIDATFIKMTNTVEPSIFHLYFRIYNPVERISNNEWTMPAIMRID